MQPTAFEDEVANSAERYNKKKKKVLDKFQTSETTPQNSPNLGRILVQETQPRTPVRKMSIEISFSDLSFLFLIQMLSFVVL